MSTLTEEQAWEKWCPWSRVMFREHIATPESDTLAMSAFNRATDGIPDGCHCIASDCMAWQWDFEHTTTSLGTGPTPDLTPPEGEGWEKYSQSGLKAYWRRAAIGFCGLAEPRIVDVEVQER